MYLLKINLHKKNNKSPLPTIKEDFLKKKLKNSLKKLKNIKIKMMPSERKLKLKMD